MAFGNATKGYVKSHSGGGGGGGNVSKFKYNLISPPLVSDNNPWGMKVSASSTAGAGFEPYTAFNGEKASTTSGNGGWMCATADSTPTLTLEFDELTSLYDVDIEILDNSSSGTFSDVHIEGSTDGTTWTNILKGASSVSFSVATGFNFFKYSLNEGKYKYFRIRGTSTFFPGGGQGHCIFSRVYLIGNNSH